jgi:hypothetical protein
MIDNFLPARTIKTGDSAPGQRISVIQAEMISRLQGLPSRLQ